MNKDLAQYCPALFEGETLYSWVSRWVIDTPKPYLGRILTELLGSRGKQVDSTFPSFIPELEKLSGINAHKLLNEHTVIPFFRSFVCESNYHKVISLIYSGDTKRIHKYLSITANRVNDTSELLYCPKCSKCDIQNKGVAYWHVKHQLPGVSACVKHGLKLIPYVKQRRSLQLPPQDLSSSVLTIASPESLKLAKVTEYLLANSFHQLDGERLADIYRYKLLNIGLASESLSVNQTELRTLLEDFWAPVMDDEAIADIFELGKSRTFPASIFYHSASQHHPLKHILIIVMLFEGMKELLMFEQSVFDYRTKPKTLTEHEFDDNENVALNTLRKGHSLREASRSSSLSVGKVKQIAVVNNIKIDRREQCIFEDERVLILEKLKRHEKTKSIAIDMGFSVGAVEQILSQNPDVVEARLKRRYWMKRYIRRAKLLIAMRNESLNTRHAIQKAASVHYNWLFRFDKQWLYRHLPAKQPWNKRNKS